MAVGSLCIGLGSIGQQTSSVENNLEQGDEFRTMRSLRQIVYPYWIFISLKALQTLGHHNTNLTPEKHDFHR